MVQKCPPQTARWPIAQKRTCLLHVAALAAALVLPEQRRSMSKHSAGACRVKCWAFEPPGGLMTRTVSRALQPLCTSTALGKDWIPRLSVASFERLRDDMVRWRAGRGSPTRRVQGVRDMEEQHLTCFHGRGMAILGPLHDGGSVLTTQRSPQCRHLILTSHRQSRPA